MDKQLLATASGQSYADIAVINGKIVNVYTGEIYDGGVATKGDKIAAVGDIEYTIGKQTKVIDAGGNFITPGFIDGHIHTESTSLSIRPFAELVLKHGTTAIMTDLHEIGVVAGLEGIEAQLAENEITDLKIYFVVPSHIPFSPSLETSGAHFDNETIKKALSREDAVGLSEIVGPYILMGFEDLFQSMDTARSMGKSLQGHLPEMKGPTMNTCLAAGVNSCHESLDSNDVLERLRNGCHAMIREGSVAKNLVEGLKPILENGLDSTYASIITDDLDTIDGVEKGHLDNAIRVALGAGLDFVKAIQMVTVNAARAFRLDHEIGGLAPGKRADINITTGKDNFEVLSVIAGGKQVVDNKELLVSYPVAKHASCLLNTTKLLNPITANSFKMQVDKDAKEVKVLAMETLPWIPITVPKETVLKVTDGVIECDIENDILYIAQVERYGINGNVGKAFMCGFGLKSGAIASSIGHDNHNIIVLGTNHEDMALAVNRLVEIGGGQIAVKNGEIMYEIDYPICGLLSDQSAEGLADRKRKLVAITNEMGNIVPIPFMFLSFICLAAIPSYAVTDHGFVDVAKQEIINPIIEVVK